MFRRWCGVMTFAFAKDVFHFPTMGKDSRPNPRETKYFRRVRFSQITVRNIGSFVYLAIEIVIRVYL